MLSDKTVYYCDFCMEAHPVCSNCKEVIRDSLYIETDGAYLDLKCAEALGVRC